jgi:hypothetical protein
VIARNNYFGGYHVGNNVGWQVLTGSYYSNASVTKNPTMLPVNMKHVAGHPLIIPESTWVNPDMYQSEGPLMVAAQSDLTGFDALFWFAQTEAEWRNDTVFKWSCDIPMLLGQFPAAALIYREGLVTEGPPAVVENRPLQDLWDRKEPWITDENGWDDPNHHADVHLPKGTVPSAVDQLAYLVGPVMVSYGTSPAKNKVLDLEKYIDRANEVVHSDTGQITTNYGQGIYRVDAPEAQGVAGFLGAAGPQQMRDVLITCQNQYATLVVVAMDGKPIEDSSRVLIQVGTINRPTGWKSQPYTLLQDGKPFPCCRLVDMGKPPWEVENTDAEVTVSNPKLTSATALDVNGMPIATPVQVTRPGAKITVVMPKDVLYVVLTAADLAPGRAQ